MERQVEESGRYESPGGRPQPLAFHEKTLWMGSLETSHLYAIDTATWTVFDEIALPGRPFGLVSMGGALRIVVSLGEADDRYLYRFVPGEGFDPESKVECPQFTGSHLATDGNILYLTQATNRRILALDRGATVVREIPLPTSCAGTCFDSETFYMISADDEFDDLHLATLDIALEHPSANLIAKISPEARGLAFDGRSWWTNYRELGEIVSFAF